MLSRNTTLTVVLTNKSLPIWALQRLGVQVHNSMARGDQPMAEGDDGDTLFTVTTGKAVGATISDVDMDHLGILASETAWDALLASLPQVPPETPRTNIVLAPKELDSIVARYAFSADAIAEVRRKGTALEIELTGHTTSSDYLTVGKPVLLTPVAAHTLTYRSVQPKMSQYEKRLQKRHCPWTRSRRMRWESSRISDGNNILIGPAQSTNTDSRLVLTLTTPSFVISSARFLRKWDAWKKLCASVRPHKN